MMLFGLHMFILVLFCMCFHVFSHLRVYPDYSVFVL